MILSANGMALTHRLKCAQYIAKQVMDAQITKDGHIYETIW